MLILISSLAARTALKRKKAHEHSLEQTSAQISMLENQIYSIESANINQETLIAMKNAAAAMKSIHGKMTMDTVDQTMYVIAVLKHVHCSRHDHFQTKMVLTELGFIQGRHPRTTCPRGRDQWRYHQRSHCRRAYRRGGTRCRTTRARTTKPRRQDAEHGDCTRA